MREKEHAGDRFEWARFLVAKLERLSADSIWAHRASGLRGALLRAIDEFDQDSVQDKRTTDGSGDQSIEQFDRLIEAGFEILERAAREIPDRKVEIVMNEGRMGTRGSGGVTILLICGESGDQVSSAGLNFWW